MELSLWDGQGVTESTWEAGHGGSSSPSNLSKRCLCMVVKMTMKR